MRPELLTMSTEERPRLQIIGHFKHAKTTVAKAAVALGLTGVADVPCFRPLSPVRGSCPGAQTARAKLQRGICSKCTHRSAEAP